MVGWLVLGAIVFLVGSLVAAVMFSGGNSGEPDRRGGGGSFIDWML